eukprot:3034314-Prymnesium_polylepis.1
MSSKTCIIPQKHRSHSAKLLPSLSTKIDFKTGWRAGTDGTHAELELSYEALGLGECLHHPRPAPLAGAQVVARRGDR